MKQIRAVITNTFCTFTVLSVLFGVLCKIGVLVELPYSDVIFPLLFMSAGTSSFVVLRECLLPDMGGAKYALEILGCSAIIFLSVHFAGWLELEMSYFLLIFAMVLVVYLMVWLLTWLQSKQDEGALNALLKNRADQPPSSKRR